MIFKTTDDGGLTNIFKELKSVQVTFEELDKTTLRSAIKSFNNTSISVEDLSKRFGGLDNSVVEYLNNTERGQASMDGLSKSIDNSAISMISATAKAKILAIALNALTGLAISLAFKGITWAIDELIVTLDEQKEKLDEAVTAYEESKSELEKINDELKTTSERIDELNGKENLTFTEQDELEKLIKTNDELERKIYLLEQANKEAEKEVVTEAQNTYDKYTNNRTLGAVEQIEFYSDSSLLEGVNWDNFKGDLSWLVAQYKNQEEILANAQANGWTNIEERAKSNLELLEGYMSEASLDYQDLYDKIGGISDFAMTEDLELAKQDLDDILDIVAEILGYGGQRSETSFDDIWNSEDFSQYKTELETLAKEGKLDASVLESNEQYKKLLEDTGATAESTAEHIKALVAETEQAETQNPDKITVSDVFSLEDAEGKATPLSDLNDQLSDVTSAYETCLAARDEYNKQGYLSVDTLQSVLALGDEYLQYLFDEEGNVSLDAEAFQKLTLARINDMETQALANLAQNIQQITDEATATEYLAQKQNELALSYTDTAASALLAMTTIEGFSDSEALQNAYNSFVTQYEQIKNLFAKTRAGIITEYNGKSKTDTDYKSILDKEITAQEKAYEAGKTTFKKYLDNRKQLVEKYYHDKKITTVEYYEELEDLAQAEADFYDDVLAAVTRRIQREIDGIEDIIDNIQKQIDQLEKQKDTYDSVISAVVRRYDKEIDGINDVIEALEKQNEALEKQQDDYDGAISAIIDFLESQKDAIQNNVDSINDENDAIQDQIDKYDMLLNAVTLVFDEKRDELSAEQNAIQERIDALTKENDEHQKALELEKAKDALYKARNQRTKYLYNGTQFVYQADYESIADAEQNLSDLNFDATIDALEKEKELLQNVIDQLDKTEEAWQKIAENFDNQKAKSAAQELFGDDYENIILNSDPEMIASIMNQYTDAQQRLEDNDNTISSLEEQMSQFDAMIEKWESVASAKEDATNREHAALLLGQQWEQIILANREADFENFKNNYLSIQDQIEDNQTLIDSYNEKITYYENLKSEWESLSSLYQEKLEDKMAQDALGADWETQIQAGRLEAFDSFKNDYLSIQAQINDNQALIDSYNEKITYYEGLKSQWESITDKIQEEADEQLITEALGANGEADILAGRMETLNNFRTQYEAVQQALADAAWASANEQIKAAQEAEKAGGGATQDSPDITSKTSLQAGGGAANLDKRLKFQKLQKFAKGGLITDKASGDLDWIAEQLGEDHIIAVRDYERVLNPQENITYEKMLKVFPEIQAGYNPAMNMKTPEYMNIRPVERVTQPVVQNINITLPNVTNNSGYDRLVQELQSLQLTAFQRTFRQ